MMSVRIVGKHDVPGLPPFRTSKARSNHGSVARLTSPSEDAAMRVGFPSLLLWVLCTGLAVTVIQGQEPGKGGLSELEQFKELKKLKDEERKRLQEESKKESQRLRDMFPLDVKVVVYLSKMGKDTKETEIEGYVGGVEVILGEKFLDVRDRPMGVVGARTLVLVRGASIVAIKRKQHDFLRTCGRWERRSVAKPAAATKHRCPRRTGVNQEDVSGT